jgi:hypothetical protein
MSHFTESQEREWQRREAEWRNQPEVDPEKEFVRETRQERSRRRSDERIARVPKGFYRSNPELYEAFKKGHVIHKETPDEHGASR